MRCERLGDRAVRVARPAGADSRALLEIVRRWPRVIDASVTEAWIGIYFEAPTEPAELPVESLATAATLRAEPRTIELRVRYDGEDLAEVAALVCLSSREVAALHESGEYTVLFLGFLPGFAYLGGLPERLVVPRRANPRPRVPQDALAIAGPYTGVYPFASAGGWRLIGTLIEPRLFSSSGALLRAGDRVRFRSAG